MRQVLVAIATAGIVANTGICVANPELSEKTRHNFTVIPPGPVSDKIDVELRLAVRNPTNEEVEYTTRFLNGEDVLHEETRTIPAYTFSLFTHWLPTSELSGKQALGYSVTSGGTPIGTGEWELLVIPSETRALPILTGGWIDPAALDSYQQKQLPTEEDVRGYVDAFHDIGINVLILTYSELIMSDMGAYWPSKLPELQKQTFPWDPVGTIIDQAAKNGQHVIVGPGRGEDLHLLWGGFDEPDRVRAGVHFTNRKVAELWNLYGHYPSFYGWYISHEANDIAKANRYYNEVADFMREFSPDKAIMISPSGTPMLSPEVISGSRYEMFVYQDAVGSGYIPYENTWNPFRRIEMLEEVYTHYAEMHEPTRKHLWSNLEIWRMDGPTYSNSYPAPWDQVKTQIDIHKKHVDWITTYELFGMMEPPGTAPELGGPKAVELYEAYRKYYEAWRASLPEDLRP